MHGLPRVRRRAWPAPRGPTCCGDWSISVMFAGGMPALTMPWVQKPVPPPTSTTCGSVGCGRRPPSVARPSCAPAPSTNTTWRSWPAACMLAGHRHRCCTSLLPCLEVGGVQLRHRQRVLPHVSGPVARVDDVVVHLAMVVVVVGEGGQAAGHGGSASRGGWASVTTGQAMRLYGKRHADRHTAPGKQCGLVSGGSLATGRRRMPWPHSCAVSHGRQSRGS